MKVFTCEGFDGYYPVGTSAVIVATSQERAYALLTKELEKMNLKQRKLLDINKIVEVKTDDESCVILNDGNY